MASTVSIRQLLSISGANSHAHFSSSASWFCPSSLSSIQNDDRFYRLGDQRFCSHQNIMPVSRATSGISPANQDDEDGVSLGTMKLPSDTDIPRFEALLFQWANSLCQGASLPLPVPLKVDKITGGVRLGFVTIGDGNTEVLVHIDCLVYPPTAGDPVPFFRAIRNGPLKGSPFTETGCWEWVPTINAGGIFTVNLSCRYSFLQWIMPLLPLAAGHTATLS